jgi:hypothetical protein
MEPVRTEAVCFTVGLHRAAHLLYKNQTTWQLTDTLLRPSTELLSRIMYWTARGSSPSRENHFFSRTSSEAHPASYSVNTWVLLSGQSCRGVKLTTRLHPMQRLKKEWRCIYSPPCLYGMDRNNISFSTRHKPRFSTCKKALDIWKKFKLLHLNYTWMNISKFKNLIALLSQDRQIFTSQIAEALTVLCQTAKLLWQPIAGKKDEYIMHTKHDKY